MKTIFTTVFSDGPGGGNPAPVFVEADTMTEQEMQKAAADLGQESVFVRKPVRPDCDLMLQYFVPDHELTICAHDTIGAITALKEEGLIEKEHLRVETKAGPVQVDWEEDEKGVLVMMEQFLPEFNDGVPSAADVAGALRIPVRDLGVSEKMPLENVSTSRYKLMVPVASREVLDSLVPAGPAAFMSVPRIRSGKTYSMQDSSPAVPAIWRIRPRESRRRRWGHMWFSIPLCRWWTDGTGFRCTRAMPWGARP